MIEANLTCRVDHQYVFRAWLRNSLLKNIILATFYMAFIPGRQRQNRISIFLLLTPSVLSIILAFTFFLKLIVILTSQCNSFPNTSLSLSVMVLDRPAVGTYLRWARRD
jgi:predicted neutral ceramidase superfamily lipid hydrolase